MIADFQLGVAAVDGLMNALTFPQHSVTPRWGSILFTTKIVK
jgi:hypothetical protein